MVFSVVWAISAGSVPIRLLDSVQVILGKIGLADTGNQPLSLVAIVWNVRLPRVLLGILLGGGLAVSGSAMQATVNNPISEPYLLGISAGATFGAVLTIVLGLKPLTGVGAFAGAVLATVLMLFIASIQGEMSTTSLILAGTVVNALFIAFANFIISLGADADSMLTIKFWTMGSLAGTSWSDLPFPAALVGFSLFFFWSQSRVLNAMMMGDETAVTLGISLPFYRSLYTVAIALVTAVLVAHCGIVGFVGLIAPHSARRLAGTDYSRLLPLAALLGAICILWADTLSRILVKNAELPIGIFTALLGAPFFIYIMANYQKGRRN